MTCEHCGLSCKAGWRRNCRWFDDRPESKAAGVDAPCFIDWSNDLTKFTRVVWAVVVATMGWTAWWVLT